MHAIVACARAAAAPLRRFHDNRIILLDLFIVSNWNGYELVKEIMFYVPLLVIL